VFALVVTRVPTVPMPHCQSRVLVVVLVMVFVMLLNPVIVILVITEKLAQARTLPVRATPVKMAAHAIPVVIRKRTLAHVPLVISEILAPAHAQHAVAVLVKTEEHVQQHQ